MLAVSAQITASTGSTRLIELRTNPSKIMLGYLQDRTSIYFEYVLAVRTRPVFSMSKPEILAVHEVCTTQNPGMLRRLRSMCMFFALNCPFHPSTSSIPSVRADSSSYSPHAPMSLHSCPNTTHAGCQSAMGGNWNVLALLLCLLSVSAFVPPPMHAAFKAPTPPRCRRLYFALAAVAYPALRRH